MKFPELQNEIPRIALEWHRERIIAHTVANAPKIRRSIRDIEPDAKPALVISAGPSLHKLKILERIYKRFYGTIIAVDGAYIACLKAGIIPDYVITLDPHPTRMVRWFGDPEFARNSEGDDYFERQDLDVEFRQNAAKANEQNISLVDTYASGTRFVVATSSPSSVVSRLETASVDPYWFVPLVDKPTADGSLTKQMVELASVPALNTGGTVGTSAWAFAHTILRSRNVAVVGMDLGYAMDTPFAQTQCYNMVKEFGEPLAEWFPHYTGYWGEAYTDPTYWQYRTNFLDLLRANNARVVNCSGAGLLFGAGVLCCDLDQWLAYSS